MHSNEPRLLTDHYLVEDLENEEPTFKFAQTDQQPMYCPKHNRWFSSSISNSFDEQTEQLPEDILSLHGQQFNLNGHLSFGDSVHGKLAHDVGKMLPNNVMLNNNSNVYGVDATKQWAIDVNQTAANQQQQNRANEGKRRKKSKVYRDHSLEYQLPFMRWKKVYNQNLNPLNAFNLNHFNSFNLPNRPSPLSTITDNSMLGAQPDSSSAAFKRLQFRKNERFSSESYETSARTNLPESEQPNVARKRITQANSAKPEQFEKQDTKQQEAFADPDLFKSASSSEKKAYWFENIRLPKLVLQFITCIIASEDYRDHILRDIEDEHVNSVSKVDTLSKYLFPLTFILVNIVYWLYYYTERSSAFDAGWKESEVFQII